jgi:hypothetical protein
LIGAREIRELRIDVRHIIGDPLERFPGELRSNPALACTLLGGDLRELQGRPPPRRLAVKQRVAPACRSRSTLSDVACT